MGSSFFLGVHSSPNLARRTFRTRPAAPQPLPKAHQPGGNNDGLRVSSRVSCSEVAQTNPPSRFLLFWITMLSRIAACRASAVLLSRGGATMAPAPTSVKLLQMRTIWTRGKPESQKPAFLLFRTYARRGGGAGGAGGRGHVAENTGQL